jgi:hypothetical protein
MSSLGQPKEALAYHRRAVEISAALAAKDPGDVRSRVEQAEAHGRLGNALVASGDPAGAVTAYGQSLTLFDSLPETTRNEVVVQYNRAVSHHEIGRALSARAATHADAGARRADMAAACDHHRQAKDLLEENMKHRPATPMTEGTRKDLAESLATCSKA